MKPRTADLLLLAAAVLALIAAPPLAGVGRRLKAESAALADVPGSIEARNSNAFARILGELRIGAADFLFVKTELYLHGGIGYAEHTDAPEGSEAMASANGSQHPHDAHDDSHAPSHEAGHADAALGDSLDIDVPADHESHAHDDEAPVATRIREKSTDFRGFLGDLEREIKPWRDPANPHVLTGGAELLPWFRLMTISNPHFIRGYRVGAMWLGRSDKYDEAIAYLDEGIAANTDNPERFLLYLSKAQMLVFMARVGDPSLYAAALESARTGLALGLQYRPDGGETGKIHKGLLWNADLEEDLLFLARFEVMLLDRTGQSEAASAAARRARSLFPQDDTLRRLAERVEASGAHDPPPAPR